MEQVEIDQVETEQFSLEEALKIASTNSDVLLADHLSSYYEAKELEIPRELKQLRADLKGDVERGNLNRLGQVYTLPFLQERGYPALFRLSNQVEF